MSNRQSKTETPAMNQASDGPKLGQVLLFCALGLVTLAAVAQVLVAMWQPQA
jgi:hypothetical protein